MSERYGDEVVRWDEPVYVISVAARLARMHPQTLRTYDRLGLVSPGRASGRGRRYSAHDIERLRTVQRLSQDEGVNLAGIKRILQLDNEVTALRTRIKEMQDELAAMVDGARRREAELIASMRRDLVPLRDAAVVPWHPQRRN